ncbi:MAG: hypothetical protein ACR2GG_01975, partial [Gemmatimonadaceae bacterium]
VALVAFIASVRRSRRLRKAIWRVASVFNDSIRRSLLEFVWSTSQLVREGQLVTPRYLLATGGMWALYLTAFGLFASSVGLSLSQVSLALLGAPLRSLFSELRRGNVSGPALAFLVFTSVPILVVVLYGLIRQRSEIDTALLVAKRFGLGAAPMPNKPISHRFRDTSDYAAFLRAHFNTTDQIVSTFAANGMDDAVVHRLLPGGSDAITAVVEVDGVLGIRKFATAGAGDKLQVQASWLRDTQSALSLAEVVSERQRNGGYQYDMPYVLTARDFYDVIHTAPVTRSMALLRDVVDDVSSFHQDNTRGKASDETVDDYLAKKVIANAKDILSYAREMVATEYTINGDPYSLNEWDCLLDIDWLRAQIRDRETAVIHGDLTIENIIVCPERPKGWYIIDPNPDNVLNTPLIDWAKLMQSLNLGYEGMNRGGVATAENDAIRVAFTKSNAYAELHTFLTSILGERIGADGLREVSFHEIVNYLRLTPYKIRHNPQKGLTFFACTATLLQRYLVTASATASAIDGATTSATAAGAPAGAIIGA